MRGRTLTVSAGERYGRLVVIGELDSVRTPNGSIKRVVECRCDCGVMGEFRLESLRSGNTKSCGCLARELAIERGHRLSGGRRSHGGTGTPEYNTWLGMIQRCESPRTSGYRNYGGRGIKVCRRWRESFAAFLEDMGRRPSEGHSIDRIDNDGDYEPGNCRWATAKEQARNSRANVMVEHEGETLCVAEWAERYGVSRVLLAQRLSAGWDFEEAVSSPPRGSDRGFYTTPIAKRDAAWYREYALREAERGS